MSEDYKNVKSAVDAIIGINSVIRRKRKADDDKKRELFVQIINRLEESNARSNIAFYDLKLDTSSYDETYMEAIDALLFMLYGKELCSLISFYLYERVDMENNVIKPVILEETGESIILENAYDLWDLMKRLNPKI